MCFSSFSNLYDKMMCYLVAFRNAFDDEYQVVVHPRWRQTLQFCDAVRKKLHIAVMTNQQHVEEYRREDAYAGDTAQRDNHGDCSDERCDALHGKVL